MYGYRCAHEWVCMHTHRVNDVFFKRWTKSYQSETWENILSSLPTHLHPIWLQVLCCYLKDASHIHPTPSNLTATVWFRHWHLSLTWFHLCPPAGSLSSPYSSLACRTKLWLGYSFHPSVAPFSTGKSLRELDEYPGFMPQSQTPFWSPGSKTGCWADTLKDSLAIAGVDTESIPVAQDAMCRKET